MKTSQVKVLAKELAKRPLTGKQIENELGIMNYKGRIFDLRREIDDFCVVSSQRNWGTVSGVEIIGTNLQATESRWGTSYIATYFVQKKYKYEYKFFLQNLLN